MRVREKTKETKGTKGTKDNVKISAENSMHSA